MRKFKSHITLDELKKKENPGGPIQVVDTRQYDRGGDFVRVTFRLPEVYGYVLYNVASGWFFGTTSEGFDIDSQYSTLDNEQWFGELLGIFYTL